MAHTTEVEAASGRKFYLDAPDDLRAGEPVTFILNLHGGGSVGAWQRLYFPAQDFAAKYRLVIATPSAATKEPARRWVGEADDEHLKAIVEQVVARYGARNIRAFWLVGHSQGGFTSHRILNDPWFQDRVDGWMSLSGGRLGAAERAEGAGPPADPKGPPRAPFPMMQRPPTPDADFSFIYTTGEHEIASLPESSPWAEKYGAGPRERRPDVVDTAGGQVHDTSRIAFGTKQWGLLPGPGTAQVWVYPNARDGRVVADVVRLNKGHTEGLEPKVMDTLLGLLVQEPGGKIRRGVKARESA